MKELSLFSGAGGGLLGTKLLGWTHVGYVEWNEYCQRVIAARIADGYLDSAPIFTDVREFAQSGAAEQYRGVADVVSAGFPCQPFSVAGKQAGADDERNMWPATVDVIRAVQPRSVLLENVPGLISCGYVGIVLSDLAALGYVGRWGVLGACDAGAPHKRERLWIVAHADDRQRDDANEAIRAGRNAIKPSGDDMADPTQQFRNGSHDHPGIGMGSEAVPESGNGSGAQEVAYAYRVQREGMRSTIGIQPEQADAGSPSVAGWATDPADDPESGLGRMAPRMAHGMDRLKAIGNGQVSAVVRRAWETLK